MSNLEKIDLKNIKTCELVEELSKRKGVEIIVEPYQKKQIKVEGPIIILKIID